MLLGLASLACLISVPLAGGRLRALADLEIRHAWILFAAVVLQVVVIEVVPDAPAPVPEAVHVVSYGLIGAFVGVNRAIPFLWLIGLGGMLNGLAILVNDGVMPARAGALATAGLRPESGAFSNSTTVDGAHLPWLGDVFAVPDGWPAANVFSVGDVLIVLGLLLALHVWCGSFGRAPRLAPVAS